MAEYAKAIPPYEDTTYGLEHVDSPNYNLLREQELNRLADVIEQHLDLDAIENLLG